MPYRIKGTLKLPATSQPAAGVEIEFISRRNYSPLLMDLSSVIKTSPTGAYDVTLEYGEYAVVLYWGCNQPSHIGKLFVFADTVTGLDLQTLLQQADWQPATPEYIQQIQDWLAQSAASASQAVNSAAAAKASETAAEADRAEVASNKNIVVSAQADVTSKRNDVTAKAAQVAANTATVNEKTPIAVAAANTATEKAASASTDAATASDAASRAETAAQAMTGAVLDGGQCNLSSGFYPPALTVGGKKYSTVWYVQVGGTVSGITYDVGDVLRYTTANNAYFKIDAVDTATAQINAHAAKVGAHPMSGVAGLEAALADKADVSSVFEATPLPDVWIPLNDSLRMITGFGDYDRVYIGDEYLELNSRSANFERATTATYTDKSGVLRTAAINEPRFEKQGLLIEGQSTNLFLNSDVGANQSISTQADKYTISFFGSGSISIAGATTGTLSGAGDSNRVSKTFDCLSGAAEITVTGKVVKVQFENLPFPSSYIPTSGAAVTRAADKCWIQVSGNAPLSELSVAAEINIPSAYKFFRPIVSLRNQTGLTGNIEITCPSNAVRIRVVGTNGITTTSTPNSEENPRSFAAVFGSAKLTLFAGGALLSAPISNPIFSYGSVIGIGKSSDAAMNSGFFGHIRNFRIWHSALSDAQIKGLK